VHCEDVLVCSGHCVDFHRVAVFHDQLRLYETG
jgi:hypothetical protein